MIVQAPSTPVIPELKAGMVSADIPFKLATPELQFRIFAMLWAIATLFHMAHSSVFDTQLNFALLSLAAFYVIFKPSLHGLLALIVLQVFDAVFRMPYTTNHWIFTAFVNLTILQSVLWLMITNRTFNVSGAELFRTFAPVVRVEVIILYFFAAFHKLNEGFFSPATSCATDLLKAQHVEAIVSLDPLLFKFNAYFTVALEFLLPVGLFFRRTRNAAILAGILFHVVLGYSSYNAFYDFSSMVFAAYFLFLSPAFSGFLYDQFSVLRNAIRKPFAEYNSKTLAFTILAIVAGIAVLLLLNKRIDTFRSVHLYFFWTVFSFLFTFYFIRFLFSLRADTRSAINFSIAHWTLAIFPIIVFANGTCPYIGLKTENSYAMFSNLRTEGGTTNHFLIPASAQVFSFQKDVVEILSSSDPGLQQLANEGRAMVLFEFRRYIHERKPDRVACRINGEPRVITAAGIAAGDAPGNNPFLLNKLMKFRTFMPSGPQPCMH